MVSKKLAQVNLKRSKRAELKQDSILYLDGLDEFLNDDDLHQMFAASHLGPSTDNEMHFCALCHLILAVRRFKTELVEE